MVELPKRHIYVNKSSKPFFGFFESIAYLTLNDKETTVWSFR
jgi:hypothetical protein